MDGKNPPSPPTSANKEMMEHTTFANYCSNKPILSALLGKTEEGGGEGYCQFSPASSSFFLETQSTGGRVIMARQP